MTATGPVSSTRFHTGDRVKVERDEVAHPPKGSWPVYRGKVGTVLMFNAGEVGVLFGRRPSQLVHRTPDAWFQRHELAPL